MLIKKSNVSNVNVSMFSWMPSDFGACLSDFSFWRVLNKTHLNNSVKCVSYPYYWYPFRRLCISFARVLTRDYQWCGRKLEYSERSRLSKRTPAIPYRIQQTLIAGIEQGAQAHSGEKRVHCPLRYSEPKSSFFDRFGMYNIF